MRDGATSGVARRDGRDGISQEFLRETGWGPRWLLRSVALYPLVICYVAIENDHRNGGFLPIENGGFSSSLCKRLPEGKWLNSMISGR